MKLILTHKGVAIDKSSIHLVIPVQAESVAAVRGIFAAMAEHALYQGRSSFVLYGHEFLMHNVMPIVRPEHELHIAVLARQGRPAPRIVSGLQGRRHIYRGATVQTLDHWFTENQKLPAAVMPTA